MAAEPAVPSSPRESGSSIAPLAETVHSSMCVDNRAVAMLADSPAWMDIVNACGELYVSVHSKGDSKRPLKWLESRESLSGLCLSLSTEAMTKDEMRSIATRIQREHSFNAGCKAFAKEEAKWLLRALSGRTLLAAFMTLPSEVTKAPGPPAPEGHSAAGKSVRVAIVHAAFASLAESRREMQDKNVGATEGFTLLPLETD